MRKKPQYDWKEIVRQTIHKRRGNAKGLGNSRWRKAKDGFMITSRDHTPTANQIQNLEAFMNADNLQQ